MVVSGYDSTVPVTLDDMMHHTKAVVRGSKRAMVVADLPFLTAHLGKEEVLRAAGRLMQEGGAQAVKMEGGEAIVDAVRACTAAGIPVMGHLGLTPQSVHQFGGISDSREGCGGSPAHPPGGPHVGGGGHLRAGAGVHPGGTGPGNRRGHRPHHWNRCGTVLRRASAGLSR